MANRKSGPFFSSLSVALEWTLIRFFDLLRILLTHPPDPNPASTTKSNRRHKGPANSILYIENFPGTFRLVTSSAFDRTVRIWDPDSQAELLRLDGVSGSGGGSGPQLGLLPLPPSFGAPLPPNFSPATQAAPTVAGLLTGSSDSLAIFDVLRPEPPSSLARDDEDASSTPTAVAAGGGEGGPGVSSTSSTPTISTQDEATLVDQAGPSHHLPLESHQPTPLARVYVPGDAQGFACACVCSGEGGDAVAIGAGSRVLVWRAQGGAQAVEALFPTLWQA